MSDTYSFLGHAFGDGGGVVTGVDSVVAGADDDVGSVLDDDSVRVVLIDRRGRRRGGDAPGSHLMGCFPKVTSTSESELSSTTIMGVGSCCL